jgi:RNA polymerase sigma-70 factor (ECF subfamily)
VAVGSASEDRLRILIDKFTPDVGSYLSHRSYPLGSADIEELVQSVFVIAWRRLDDIPAAAELPWLIGVARNVLNNARRGHFRRIALLSRLTPRSGEPSAEELVTANESLKRAFESLSRSDREILLLRYWEGLESADVGVVLGIRSGTASTRLTRATSRLRTNFNLMGTDAVKTEVNRT